jgi:hypothetical protein
VLHPVTLSSSPISASLIKTWRLSRAADSAHSCEAGQGKDLRAEGVTPITTAGLLALPRDAPWRADFVKEMGDFPVGQHDDVTDAFCHAMKSFTTERDFKAADLSVMPGPVLSDEEQRQEDMREEVEYLNNTRIGDFGDF